MRIFLVWILTSASIILGQPLTALQPQASRTQSTIHSSSDTLEIRSGASSKVQSVTTSTISPQPSPSSVPQRDSVSVALPSTPVRETARTPIKKLSRKEILKIPLEELLDLPMETVLEYAKVIDSMKIAETSSSRAGRTSGKSKRSNSSLSKAPDTQILDKLNATLQQLQAQKQSGKKGTLPANVSREELLRMKLKDLLDMRLGEILKLVNPILASSATSGAQKTPR